MFQALKEFFGLGYKQTSTTSQEVKQEASVSVEPQTTPIPVEEAPVKVIDNIVVVTETPVSEIPKRPGRPKKNKTLPVNKTGKNSARPSSKPPPKKKK